MEEVGQGVCLPGSLVSWCLVVQLQHLGSTPPHGDEGMDRDRTAETLESCSAFQCGVQPPRRRCRDGRHDRGLPLREHQSASRRCPVHRASRGAGLLGKFFHGSPDAVFEAEEVIAYDDRCVVRWIYAR